MTRPLRSTGVTPLHHYYGAVRPSPAHRYFRPRGWSRLRLVWGFCCQAVSEGDLAFLIGFFVRPGIPFLRPDPQYCKAGARRSCQGWPSHQLSTRSALARPYLDSSEHGGTLDAVGMTIRGEPAFGRA